MYSPHMFEMLAPMTHAERLRDAERKRFALTALESGLVGRAPLVERLHRRTARVSHWLTSCAVRIRYAVPERQAARVE
jgi:hypothetical protein